MGRNHTEWLSDATRGHIIHTSRLIFSPELLSSKQRWDRRLMDGGAFKKLSNKTQEVTNHVTEDGEWVTITESMVFKTHLNVDI